MMELRSEVLLCLRSVLTKYSGIILRGKNPIKPKIPIKLAAKLRLPNVFLPAANYQLGRKMEAPQRRMFLAP